METAIKYPTNEEIVEVLDRVADLLEAQDANTFRVRAYRDAARYIEQYPSSIAEMIRSESGKQIEALPHIGESIGGALREFVHTRRLMLLERLEGQVSPEALFTTVPGIGEELARRIHKELKIDTLEELEVAAHDGRLKQVPGIGERRVRGIRDTLASMLRRSTRRRARRMRMRDFERKTDTGGFPAQQYQPGVDVILDVDREYRSKADAGRLRTIAPRRFNPEGKSWLPILHTERGSWNFTALFSNTSRAHELGKTHDWVVIYYEQDGHENQCTVVTEHRGPLQGQRVVRGREKECRQYYASTGSG